VSAVTLVGCSPSTAISSTDASQSSDARAVVAEAASLLPEDLAAEGTIVVATNAGLEPFTYRASDGQITGADIDLVRELAERLGLAVQVEEADFDSVLAGVAADEYDLGASGIFNTPERRASLDFVDYLRGGTQWAIVSGAEIDPDDACGLRIAAIAQTVQADVDIPDRSQDCLRRGEPALDLVVVDSSAQGAEAVLRGEADAFVSDAPVVAHLVGISKGRLASAGPAYDPQMYGLVVSRDSPGLREALAAALRSAIEDGTYARIMGKWGIQEGSISLQ
jgi:polar amino acid transport system substrate-binding protein